MRILGHWSPFVRRVTVRSPLLLLLLSGSPRVASVDLLFSPECQEAMSECELRLNKQLLEKDGAAPRGCQRTGALEGVGSGWSRRFGGKGGGLGAVGG